MIPSVSLGQGAGVRCCRVEADADGLLFWERAAGARLETYATEWFMPPSRNMIVLNTCDK